MKTVLAIILFLSIVDIQIEDKHTLRLQFEVTQDEVGTIYCSLYDSEGNHMKKAFQAASAPVQNNEATLIFNDLPSGYYTYSFYHDVNQNGTLNANKFGIPKEPYGFSNGQKGTFGPPDFEKAKFQIQNDTLIQIKTK